MVGSGPAHAAAFTLNPDGSFSYTPTADYNGPDSFTYKLNDGSLDSNTATVSLTVTAVNDAPVATNDSFTTAEDTALSGNVIANTVPNSADSDIDSATNNLTATVVGSGPAHAAAFTLNPDGSFSYTPTADYNGPDSFTYKLNDGSLDSNTATVSLTVTAVNDAPVAQDDAFTTAEDTALSGNVIANTVPNGADSDIDTSQANLTATVVERAGARCRVHPQSRRQLQLYPDRRLQRAGLVHLQTH